MKGLARSCAAILLLLGIVDCSGSGETTEWCDEACTIWHDCTGWDLEICISECRAEGDWDEDYLACIQAQPCNNLRACE